MTEIANKSIISAMGKRKRYLKLAKKKSFIIKYGHVANGNTFLDFCIIHSAQIK